MRGRQFLSVALLAPVLSVSAASCGSTGLPTSGTATITWKPNPPLSTKAVAFTGTIGGDPVQGTAASPDALATHSAVGTALPKSIEVGHWTGRFEGRAFSVALTLQDFKPSFLLAGEIVADGTYGSQRIHATSTPNLRSPTLVFRGTIGRHHLQVTIPSFHNGHATATFTLTG